METYSYVGRELELFQHAVRWKAYCGRVLRPFIVGDVLEVGAGLGATSRFLCDGRQSSWTCLEPDPALHGQLEAGLRARPLPSPTRVVLGTVASLAPEEGFDTILYVDVLEHIEDDRAELVQGAASLRPSGHLMVLAPAHQWLYSPFDQAIGHFRRCSRQSLLAAGPSSLQPVTVFYLDSLGVATSLANRLLLGALAPTHAQVMFWDRVLVPFSRLVDPLVGRSVGRSVVGVWTRPPRPGAVHG